MVLFCDILYIKLFIKQESVYVFSRKMIPLRFCCQLDEVVLFKKSFTINLG